MSLAQHRKARKFRRGHRRLRHLARWFRLGWLEGEPRGSLPWRLVLARGPLT